MKGGHNLIILANKKGLELNQKTKPVGMNYSFISAVFNIEKDYDMAGHEYFNTEKRKRKINHLTWSDLQLAITLLVGSNTNGNIYDTTPHCIYQKTIELFEKPISIAEFYAALEKFKLHNLIEEIEDRVRGVFTYKLLHFLDPESKKIGRYIPVHPIIFTKEFHELPISHKKLFFAGIAQQGQSKHQVLARKLKNDKECLLSAGLLRLLHKQYKYQVEEVVQDLTNTPILGNPLLSVGEVNKISRGEYTVNFSISPYYIIEKGAYTENFREPIQPKNIYCRLSKWMTEKLETIGVGEIVTYNDGKTFRELVGNLRKYSRLTIEYALHQLKDYYMQYNRTLPKDVYEFISKTLINNTQGKILETIRRSGLDPFLAPSIVDITERRERHYQVANRLSVFPLKRIQELCEEAVTLLITGGQLRQSKHNLGTYMGQLELNNMIPTEISVVRKRAYHLKRDIHHYHELEQRAFEKLKAGKKKEAVLNWLLEQVDQLEMIPYLPQIDKNFKLEEYLFRVDQTNSLKLA